MQCSIKTFLLPLALMAWTTGTAMADSVGELTAVQTNVDRNGTVAQIGSGISLGDTLVSNTTGLGMIVFIDQSSAKIGPNSRLVIDDFVYSGGTGKSAVRMDRGVTRFYGGRISKKGAMSITTPNVVLAVRGGIVDVSVAGGVSIATLRAGKLTCTAGGVTKVITKPGMACTSDSNGLRIGKTGVFKVLNPAIGTGDSDGIDSAGLCSGKASSRLPFCQSRNGQLPGFGSQGSRTILRIPPIRKGDY
ncbi:FecR family protein [Hoeflea marina]|uniref:FecR family protein n=1 Tax=Hoeflea marina TaxID=274592 RepID=A0A317PIV5_9HYPH|nr:FecR family protein [Hoeflea marina]PWV99949.1 FecR family protein [Hoeflea marina]